MNHAVKYMIRMEDGVDFFDIFRRAVDHLRDVATENGRRNDDGYLDAARSGTRFLAESSCSDTGARGRASKRREAFLLDILEIDKIRACLAPGRR